ncbi:MAG TPA: hypothetical protein PLV83_00380 [Bacilli bacterium]|nr:hypothetical protein [Bacilli bacterium]
MKKAGLNMEKNNDLLLFIFIAVIILIFIFGLKPIYKTFDKLKSGTLFEKTKKVETKPVEEEKYVILKPSGTNKLTCKSVVSDNGGDKTIYAYLYYTDNKLKSIKEDISYSSITDEYSNYILAEQSKYKQRKTSNLTNKGYSIEVNLDGTTSLKISEVFLLVNADLKDMKLGKDDKLDVIGEYNDDIYELSNKYVSNNYSCQW